MKGAITQFELAIEKEPAYAAAYAGLADSYIVLGYYSALRPGEAFRKGGERQ